MKAVVFLLTLLVSASVAANTVYLTRHFEKQKGENPSLTAQGKARANALAMRLKDTPFRTLYSTNYARTQETAAPLSAVKNMAITLYDPRSLEAFATQLKSVNEDVVVVGHSNTTPALIALLGGPKVTIEESDYGTLFILERSEGNVELETEDVTF